MNINDERAKEIHNCICYECSGINGNGKETFKIYNSLHELKTHCNNLHNGSFLIRNVSLNKATSIFLLINISINSILLNNFLLTCNS